MSYEGEVLHHTEGTEDRVFRLKVPDAERIGHELADALTTEGMSASVGILGGDRLIVRLRAHWSSTTSLERRHSIFKTWLAPGHSSYHEMDDEYLMRFGRVLATVTGEADPRRLITEAELDWAATRVTERA